MAVKYRRERDERGEEAVDDLLTARRRRAPWQRQRRDGMGELRWRVVLLYLAVFAVVFMLYAGSLLAPIFGPSTEVITGVGRILSKESTDATLDGEPMGLVLVAFPADGNPVGQARWEVPLPLWEALQPGDLVAVRYRQLWSREWVLLDAGYVALPKGEPVD